jgi:hypothetical protein
MGRYRSSGNVQRGRLWVILIWIFMQMVDITAFVTSQMTPLMRHQMIGVLINDFIWTTAWLTAICFRQNWARYVMVINLLLGVALETRYLQWAFEFSVGFPIGFVVSMVGRLAVAIMLIVLPDIKRLTNPTHF